MMAVNIEIRFGKRTLGTILIIILATVVGFFIVNHYSDQPDSTQIPASAISRSTFPVYAPVNPPPGFALDQNSISENGQAFVYSYSYDTNKHLAVTVQPLPKNFDSSKFNPTKEVETNIGRAYMVDLDARTTAAVVTSKSLLFINAPQKISLDVLEQFINSMRSVK